MPRGTEVPDPFWGMCEIMCKSGIKSTGALRPHLPFQYCIHVLLWCGYGIEMVIFYQIIYHGLRHERRQCRSDIYVAHAQRQQGEKNADGFLFVP